MVAEFLEGERTQGEFCRARGIAVGTLQCWLRKIAGAEGAVNGSARNGGFVELKVEGPGPGKTETEREGDHREYELILATGARLLVRGGFELGEVNALLTLLEARG